MKKLLLLLPVLFLLLTIAGCEGTDSDQNHTETGNDSVVIAPPKTSNVLAKVRSNGVYGYIDTLGNYIISPQYPMAKSFSQGRASVNIGGIRQPGMTGVEGGIYEYIDGTGKQVTHLAMTTTEGFTDGIARYTDDNRQWGWINLDGEVVASGFDMLNPFGDGMAIAAKVSEDTYGYVDQEGNWALKTSKEETIGDFNDGLAFKVENGKFGYMDKTGAWVVRPKYEVANNFSDGMAMVSNGGKYGFINTKGEEVIALQFQGVGSFQNGYAGVMRDGKWGYIGKDGKFLIDFRFDNVRSFNEGIAAVLVGGKVGYVKENGDWLLQPQFQDGSDFHQGRAAVKQNGLIGYINNQGQLVIPHMYEVGGGFVDIREETDPRYF